jgi:hypothetical protein
VLSDSNALPFFDLMRDGVGVAVGIVECTQTLYTVVYGGVWMVNIAWGVVDSLT